LGKNGQEMVAGKKGRATTKPILNETKKAGGDLESQGSIGGVGRNTKGGGVLVLWVWFFLGVVGGFWCFN